MARTSQIAQVGKRKLELSNLKKVLFPEHGIVKAELIEFYLKLAPTILSHVKGRALTLVRYPDGIHGETFFQKRRPDWAPEWIDHVSLGDTKKIDYVLLSEEASLVWLANLACIELHQTHYRKPKYENPDYFVFDLDPPDNYGFTNVTALAFELREHLENHGYHPFVKTTGRKGLHIVCPIEPKFDFKQIFEAAQVVAKSFVAARAGSTTLHIKKESRKGRVLIDIYRNRQFQTIISPYSVRGLPGAPVSTPLSWEQLETVEDPSSLDIYTVPDMVLEDGDQWEAIAAYSTPLHTQRRPKARKNALKKSRTYKTPEQLETYAGKRSFDKTPEPTAGDLDGLGNAFVVHRHHASRLHYDLRLEHEGTLRSWAVPKGLPPRPGIKRLAVNVEDHPIEYLNFEGSIPKGEYGGGHMWVFAQGRYEITKEKKDGFYFRLQSRELNAEYRTYKTKGKDWLLERVDNPQVDWLVDPPDFMLASSRRDVPASGDYLYEVKWDGIRAMITLDEGEVRILSRNRRDITEPFAELLAPDKAFRASSLVLDAEIVCLDDEGRPLFKDVINRMRQTTESAIKRGMSRHPVVCYVFDLLYLDGRPVHGEPIERRREWLTDVIKTGSAYRVSETVADGSALFAATSQMGLEGIMAKEAGSRYYPGKRSTQWVKIKARQTADCVIIGYTQGKGDRASTFGALHLAQYDSGNLHYVGKVGTGFDDRKLRNVLTELKKVKEANKRPVKEKPLDDAQSVWLEPKLLCEVEYASLTNKGTLREPVFVRMRPDLSIENKS
jgi:DNA ligase D-like protein (predicted ligase)/DNA ligase D-like protein (predicted polymerase)/DNA ligase D-like protein (predicted 3'-phosphoesterase)